MTETIRARLGKRYYIASEYLTPTSPRWLHRLVCSHCRGLDAYAKVSAIGEAAISELEK